MSEYILQARNISKSFPGVKALDNISLGIRKGEVHALVGENGAGKSTLVKIFNGNYVEDSGEILFDGRPVRINHPLEAKRLGISIIFQEFNLVERLSIAENIYLGRLPKKGHIVDWKKAYSDAERALARIGYQLDPRKPIAELSVAEKQIVEIAKAISYENTRIIFMDEPTATLTAQECDMLFRIVRELKAQGIAVVYISHRLEEIFELCDWVTILRDGCLVESKPIGELTRNQITEKMIGREISDEFPRREKCIQDVEVLQVKGLSRKGVLEDISFTLRKGEVLGLAGLVGAGRTEVARAISGIDYIDGGEVYINGQRINLRDPFDAIRHGLCYLSEDRKNEGVVGRCSVKWNLVMANMERITTGPFISGKKEVSVADSLVEMLDVRTPSLEQEVFNLSGGNQQKVVVGKWLNSHAQIFIFDEPTRGIDVGAKYAIYLLINRLVEEGKSVILISSELPEVLGMSDRVLVMRNGRISAELVGDEITATEFIRHAI